MRFRVASDCGVMPEGDTLYRLAARMHAALAGEVLGRVELRMGPPPAGDATGGRTREVVARGKHLLHRIEPAHGGEPLTLRSHLRMDGRWLMTAATDRIPGPHDRIRALLETSARRATGLDLGELELIRTADESVVLGHLGPDILGPDWDAAEAIRRLGTDSRSAAVALSDQRNLAGLGNIYVQELCFLRGIDPRRPLDAAEIPAVVALAVRLMRANRDRRHRVTTGIDRPGARVWVAGRAGKSCRRCGSALLRERLGADPTRLRELVYCPHCQR